MRAQGRDEMEALVRDAPFLAERLRRRAPDPRGDGIAGLRPPLGEEEVDWMYGRNGTDIGSFPCAFVGDQCWRMW